MTTAELYTDDIDVIDDQERGDQPSGRQLLIRLMRWDEVADTPQGREAFSRGAFAGTDPGSVIIESQAHGGAIVGKGIAIEDDGDGPLLRAVVSRTHAGDDLLTLLGDKVLKRASVVFKPTTSRRRPDGVIERIAADLRKVAILPKGAYASAEVVAVRSAEMPEAIEGELLEAVVPPVDMTPIYQRFDAMDEAIARVAAAGSFLPVESGELQRHATFGDAWLASTEDPEQRQQLQRALADQITADNPGLVPAGWLSTIRGLIAVTRRGINAFGGPRPLPESGMTFNWPKVTDATKALADSAVIAVQATQKAEVVSAKVSFDSAAASIKTFAGASDVSLQLLRRSSPSYRDAYLRFMTARWARVTDNDFIDTVAAVAVPAGADGTLDLAAGATAEAKAEALLDHLFRNSVYIESVTGQPASVVLAASDVFAAMGKLAAVMPPSQYGVQNVAGTADASTLQVSASGLRIIHEPNLAAGKMVIAAPEAAAWHEEGSPFVIEESDVAKLGLNIAVWSMGVAAVYEPAAIVVTTVTVA